MLKKPLHWLLYIGIWVLMGLYYTSWDMAVYRAAFLNVLPMNLCQNAVWGLEGLLIIRLAERFPIESFSRRSLPAWILNLGAGFVLALLGLGAAWLIALGFQVLENPAMAAKASFKGFTRFLFMYLHSTLILMWAVLGAFHGFLLFKGMKTREMEKAQLETSLALARNQTLLAQFQPHFLFNALNSISSLIHSDPERADRMVARLGDLLRINLDTQSSQEVPLATEMELVEAFLAIEKIRFQDRLEVILAIPPELARRPVPKFILQPLVENALKHGIAPRSGLGQVTIRATVDGDRLILEVQDNGGGFIGTREGIGLRNTRARLQMLYRDQAQLEIFSLPDKGTRVLVRIPLQ